MKPLLARLARSSFLFTLAALIVCRLVPDLPAADTVPKGLTASDWNGIRAAYEARRHEAIPAKVGYRAHNPGQQWQTRFDGRGFITKPDAGGWQWGLELKSYGFAGDERSIRDQPEMRAEGQRVIYKWDASVQEWFVNDRRGLEHGFTIEERPAKNEADVALEFDLAVRGDLRPKVSADGSAINFLNSEGVKVVNYSALRVWDADGKILPARFEPLDIKHRTSNIKLSVDERGARYPITIDPIAQQAYLKASNTGADDSFGQAVAISGDTVVVGASIEASDATGINGDETNNNLTQAGAAYVFVRNGATWSQQAYLKASNTGMGDLFGYSVAISGDTIVIGARWEDSSATGVDGDQSSNGTTDSGAVYVFVRNGTTWSQQAYLKASNTGGDDYFGGEVAISGDTLVVSAPFESSGATGVDGNQADNGAFAAGAAYVFVRNGTTWSQQAYLKASNTASQDQFGGSIGISGDTVIVGAMGEDSSATGINGDQANNSALTSGAAYVFVRNGTAWSQQAYLKASNTGADDRFGWSAAISGDTAVVSAFYEKSNATGVNGDQTNNSLMQAGAAYVFVRNGTTWSQQAYLKASNTNAFDQFGDSVAISGDTLVIGASREGSNATGVDGNQSDNSAQVSGAAYVFTRSGTTWSQQAYLKASNTDTLDEFGYSVAISGDTVVIGAYQEQSDATGVNGDESNNDASSSGAAYVFSGLGPATIACVSPPPGMSSWWRGDGNADDSVGGHHGSLMAGATFGSGEVDQAFQFNGGSEAVSIPDSPAWDFGANDFTIDTWVYLTADHAVNALVAHEATSTDRWVFWIAVDQLGFHINNSAEPFVPFTPPLGEWFHVAMTRTGGDTYKFYVNGIQVGSDVIDSTIIPAVDAPLTLGKSIEDISLSGLLDEVELFNRALDASEILAIYEAGPAGKCKCTEPPANMVSWWPGEGDGNDIQDGNALSPGDGNGFGFAPGKVGTAFDFNGSQFATAGTPANLVITGTEVTIDGWINPTSGAEGHYFGRAVSSGNDYAVLFTNGTLNGVVKTAAGEVFVAPGFTPPSGVWTHVAMTYDGATIRLYADGVEIGSEAQTGNISDSGAPFNIGGRSDGFNFTGDIDEVEVFDRALSETEIAAIYGAGSAGKCRSCVPAPANLVGWWPGDGNLNDIKGGNDGTLQGGATFAAGEVGQAFSFDGDNDYVGVPGTFGGGSEVTIDAWIRTEAVSTEGLPIQAIVSSTASEFVHLQLSDNSSFSVVIFTNGDTISFPILPESPIGVWRHIAITAKSGDSRLYVNGVQTASSSVTFSTITSTSNLRIGSGFGGVRFFHGQIDEVEIFNRALSDTEIAAIYDAGSGGKCKPAIPVARQLANISSRASVGTGDNVTIGGFIIHSEPENPTQSHLNGNPVPTKRVLIRGIGPSLEFNGMPVAGRLQDPVLELHDEGNGGALLETNDNWGDAANATDIQASGLAPSDPNESAILVTLNSDNAYTAILRGAGGTTGIGLVEVFDLEVNGNTHLANISTRSQVLTGDDVLIGGIIVQGDRPTRVLLRAIGPSLSAHGVPGPLADPILELHDINGALLETNDDWMNSPEASEITATGLAPTNPKESAILFVPAPGNYTAIVSGVGGTTGVGLVEAYRLGPVSP